MKECSECKKLKKRNEFYFKDKEQKFLENKCKECKRKENRKRYRSKKGSWLYIIKINDKIRYVGSTTYLSGRLSAHKNPNKKDGIIFKARKADLDLSNSKIDFYVCNLKEDMGLNMDEKDLKYYEHLLIKDFLNIGEELLNIIDKSTFLHRDRFVDEIPISGFNFNKHSTIYIE